MRPDVGQTTDGATDQQSASDDAESIVLAGFAVRAVAGVLARNTDGDPLAMATLYTIKLSEAICAALSLDERELRREIGLSNDGFKLKRHGATYTGTLDEIAKLADYMKRDSMWDLPPQSIAACNRRSKQLATFVAEQRAGKDLK